MKFFANFSMLKSGTHLLRFILQEITSLEYYEPQIITGKNNYEDQTKFKVVKNKFFSWHLFPYQATCKLLSDNKFKSICLVRNIFDQTFSLYNHFKFDVDHEIGRGRGVKPIFDALSRSQGINLLIDGQEKAAFPWKGSVHQIAHLKTLYETQRYTDNLFLTYEELTSKKHQTILKIANFLNVDLEPHFIQEIIQNTSFEEMKKSQNNKSHFVEGKNSKSLEILDESHLYKIDEQVKNYFSELKLILSDNGYGYLLDQEELSDFKSKIGSHEINI